MKSFVQFNCPLGSSEPPMLPYNLSLPPLLAAQPPALPSFCADSQRSHLSSFTMKLMDKFHSPKIKRTPSKKGKQLQPEPAVKSTEKPANKVCVRARLEVRSVGNPPLSQPLFPTVFVWLFARWLFSPCFMLSRAVTPLCVHARLHASAQFNPLVPTITSDAAAAGRAAAGALNLYRHKWKRVTSWISCTAPSPGFWRNEHYCTAKEHPLPPHTLHIPFPPPHPCLTIYR